MCFIVAVACGEKVDAVSKVKKRAPIPSSNVHIGVGVDIRKEPDAFRGVKWLATQAEAAAEVGFGEDSCHELSVLDAVEIWCADDFELGRITATSEFVFVRGHFVQAQVSYYPSEYDFVRAVFVEKYGKPLTEAVVPVQTPTGVQYDNDTAVWEFPNLSIEMHRYGTTIQRGVAFMTLKTWTTERALAEEAAKKKAQGSF
ncbi:MAG TPA: hypothetical protein VK504_17445 [Vicinamibacterales bacterium]|nr:hypothetical protein [Vicinamibacterales bacterium]